MALFVKSNAPPPTSVRTCQVLPEDPPPGAIVPATRTRYFTVPCVPVGTGAVMTRLSVKTPDAAAFSPPTPLPDTRMTP